MAKKEVKAHFTFIDLFAGIGGFHLAGKQLGGKCVFSSEWDKAAQMTYEKNFGYQPFGDITDKENKQRIPKKFDLLFAGFPCQPFSYAGQNKGFSDKTRGTLFFDVLEILKNHKPASFVLENVKGLVSHKSGATLMIIEAALKDLGYHIKWQVMNSYHFGLPQYRERWYCVGFKTQKQAEEFNFPVGTKTGSKLKDIIDKKSENDPVIQLSEFEKVRIDYHYKHEKKFGNRRVKHDNSKYAKGTKKGRHGIYSFIKPDGSLRFHVGDYAKTQIQEAYYASVNSYAPTIIANRVPKLLELRRKLSVLEAQRLQGFPDDFIFPTSPNQAYKQLGNSVSVPVVKAIIDSVLKKI